MSRKKPDPGEDLFSNMPPRETFEAFPDLSAFPEQAIAFLTGKAPAATPAPDADAEAVSKPAPRAASTRSARSARSGGHAAAPDGPFPPAVEASDAQPIDESLTKPDRKPRKLPHTPPERGAHEKSPTKPVSKLVLKPDTALAAPAQGRPDSPSDDQSPGQSLGASVGQPVMSAPDAPPGPFAAVPDATPGDKAHLSQETSPQGPAEDLSKSLTQGHSASLIRNRREDLTPDPSPEAASGSAAAASLEHAAHATAGSHAIPSTVPDARGAQDHTEGHTAGLTKGRFTAQSDSLSENVAEGLSDGLTEGQSFSHSLSQPEGRPVSRAESLSQGPAQGSAPSRSPGRVATAPSDVTPIPRVLPEHPAAPDARRAPAVAQAAGPLPARFTPGDWLAPNQRRVLEFLLAARPALIRFRDIGAALSLPEATARTILRRLRALGLLSFRKARDGNLQGVRLEMHPRVVERYRPVPPYDPTMDPTGDPRLDPGHDPTSEPTHDPTRGAPASPAAHRASARTGAALPGRFAAPAAPGPAGGEAAFGWDDDFLALMWPAVHAAGFRAAHILEAAAARARLDATLEKGDVRRSLDAAQAQLESAGRLAAAPPDAPPRDAARGLFLALARFGVLGPDPAAAPPAGAEAGQGSDAGNAFSGADRDALATVPGTARPEAAASRTDAASPRADGEG